MNSSSSPTERCAMCLACARFGNCWFENSARTRTRNANPEGSCVPPQGARVSLAQHGRVAPRRLALCDRASELHFAFRVAVFGLHQRAAGLSNTTQPDTAQLGNTSHAATDRRFFRPKHNAAGQRAVLGAAKDSHPLRHRLQHRGGLRHQLGARGLLRNCARRRRCEAYSIATRRQARSVFRASEL